MIVVHYTTDPTTTIPFFLLNWTNKTVLQYFFLPYSVSGACLGYHRKWKGYFGFGVFITSFEHYVCSECAPMAIKKFLFGNRETEMEMCWRGLGVCCRILIPSLVFTLPGPSLSSAGALCVHCCHRLQLPCWWMARGQHFSKHLQVRYLENEQFVAFRSKQGDGDWGRVSVVALTGCWCCVSTSAANWGQSL